MTGSRIDDALLIVLLAVMIVGVAFVRRIRRPIVQKRIITSLFYVYFITVLWVTVFSRTSSSINNVRFQIISLKQLFSIRTDSNGIFQGIQFGRMYWECRFNIFLFIPYGFLIPEVWKKIDKWWKAIALGISLSLMIEVLQYISHRGWFDLDDIFLNACGALIGYILCVFILHKGSVKQRSNIFSKSGNTD